MISRSSAGVTLAPSPIDPEWIEDGDPQARSAILAASADRGAWTVLWECTSGRFTWRYDIDETVHFLAGSVVVSAPGMPARRYGAGDTIHFSRGAVATWEVEGFIRKVAFCRRAPPRPIARAMRLARSVHRRLRALAGGGKRCALAEA
jgi:uncharacterized cupin superfamily protein